MLDDHAARVARGENWLIKDREELLGVVALVPQAAAMHLFSIAIAPEAQGRGLLREVMAFAESEARKRQLDKLSLYTNVLMQKNRAIYRHLGFVETAMEQAGGYEIVFMERPV